MKIITDQNLIDYRIALQQQMYQANSDFCLFLQQMREKLNKKAPITERDLRILRNKFLELAGIFYEMEYGPYFAKKDKGFKEKIINSLTKKYYANIFNKNIDDIFSYTLTQVYVDMDNELKKQIKADNNGK